MAAKVLLLEIQPRIVATGARTTIRLAGGGANYGYNYGGQSWRAGLAIIPTIGAQLDFDGKNFALGAVPQALQLEWSPSADQSINTMAALHWKDAPFTLYMGDENAAGALPAVLLTGKCMAHKITDSVLQLAMADPAAGLKRPIIVDTFAGTGGVEGPAEWKGRRKRRMWGYCFNVEGEPIDPPNNIYCFSDPARQLAGFAQVRDKGAAASTTTTLAWQGSVAATFAALQAAAAPAGGGVLCPSIGMVKWWTRPAGALCADIQGENAGGYSEYVAGIVSAILTSRAGPALAAGTVAAINAIRPNSCGYVADDLDTEISAALDWLLGGCSLLWVLDAATGQIRIEPWAFTASAGTFNSDHAVRVNSFPPLKSRRIGYRRNHRVHAPGDIAAILTYGDGTPIDDYQSRIVTAIRPDGSLQGLLWGGAGSVQITEVLEAALTGKSLSLDSDFSRGVIPSNYSIYDNSGGGKVTASVVADASAPNGSGKVVRISYDGTGTPGVNPTPAFGGVAQLLSSAGSGLSRPGYYSPNSKIAFIIKAKIPVGRTINHASNTTGAEGGWTWITPTAGTGGWFTYIGIRTIGWTGTLSTTGHTYVDGGANVAFSWDIAMYDQRELSSEALPQLARLIDGTGGIRTDNELITLLGTSAAIVGQGYFATQNYADWQSRIIGTGKPSDNAGTTLTLYAYDPSKYTIQGNTVTRTAASAWDTCVFSRESLSGSFRVSAQLPADGTAIMFGVTDNPGTGGDYAVIDYGWYNNYGTNTYGIYESGAGQGASGAVDSNLVVSIEYDGEYIRYFKGSTLIKSTPTVPGRTFNAVVAINSVGAKLPWITFTPLNSVTASSTTVGPLVTFGNYSVVTGNKVRKIGGTHGAVEGGAFGTMQKGTAFVSARPVQQPTWLTLIGFADANNGPTTNHIAAGNWHIGYLASGTGAGSMYIAKGGVQVGTWGVPNYNANTRIALVFNGRRIFAMLDGAVYGGDTSAYDVTPGTIFFPMVWDYYATGYSNLDIADVRYGAWTDVRTYLDDGYTVLNQAGFRTIEGVSASVVGQGPGATAPGAEVLNYIDAAGGGNGMTLIRSPGGGQYAYEGGITGAIRIDMPVGYANTMIRFTVDIFNYATGTQQTYIISGYMYQPSAAWINISAQYIGAETESKRVRFGSTGAVCSVWIGETSTIWQYPKILIRDVMAGYSTNSAATWKANWGILIATTAPEAVNNQVLKPRPGDAVFGESVFESAGAAAATLANFKTALGTSAAIVNQGALAILNNVDMATSYVLPRGSIPPMFADNGFTYTSTISTITFSWPSMTIYRPDGTTITIASGSQGVTGLASGTQYRIYPYVVDNGGSSGTIAFVTAGGSPVYGTPQILYAAAGNVTAASLMSLQGRIPMGQFNANTTTSGSGGGGGGGWNCLHEDTLVRNGRAGDLREGDTVDTPDGNAIVDRIVRNRCARWIELWSGPDMVAKVTEAHLFYRAKDGSEVRAKDVRLGDFLKAADSHVEITGLKLCREAAVAVGIGVAEPHMHFMGQRRLLCHNGTAKP